jgi:hypothetical protein
MEAKVRHPLRDNEAHAALIAIRAGELLCRCHLPEEWRSMPGLVTEVVAVLACDEAFIVDEATLDTVELGFAVEVLWAASTGTISHSLLPYRVESRSVVWEPTRRPGSSEHVASEAAEMLQAMSSGFGRETPFLDRDIAREAFSRLGVAAMFSDDAVAVFDVDRGDPCPCGSGLRFEDCHDA